MNKNSMRRKAEIREAVKAGNNELTFDRSYTHKHGNRYANITVSVPRGDALAPRRNMRQRILTNSGGGASSSLTSHEPIDRTRVVRHKNHGYLAKEYKQPTGAR